MAGWYNRCLSSPWDTKYATWRFPSADFVWVRWKERLFRARKQKLRTNVRFCENYCCYYYVYIYIYTYMYVYIYKVAYYIWMYIYIYVYVYTHDPFSRSYSISPKRDIWWNVLELSNLGDPMWGYVGYLVLGEWECKWLETLIWDILWGI